MITSTFHLDVKVQTVSSTDSYIKSISKQCCKKIIGLRAEPLYS